MWLRSNNQIAGYSLLNKLVPIIINMEGLVFVKSLFNQDLWRTYSNILIFHINLFIR